jgi:hypothetical protein
MEEHGMVGRRYAGKVQQIITGSIGFDDWEWGVDLFAPEPLVFKKLIYEMRFDHVSAVYALFGSFYVGLRPRLRGGSPIRRLTSCGGAWSQIGFSLSESTPRERRLSASLENWAAAPSVPLAVVWNRVFIV